MERVRSEQAPGRQFNRQFSHLGPFWALIWGYGLPMSSITVGCEPTNRFTTGFSLCTVHWRVISSPIKWPWQFR